MDRLLLLRATAAAAAAPPPPITTSFALASPRTVAASAFAAVSASSAAVSASCAAAPGLPARAALRSNRLVPAAAAADYGLQAVTAPAEPWWTWSVLLWSGAFGMWSEKRTPWGSALSGALVSTLVALVASNLGIVSPTSPVYSIVNSYLLPLAVPLLLFSADLRRLVTSTGRLFLAFCLGSVATIAGTVVAIKLVPLERSLGGDGWKIAAALMSRHIGGAVNYVAVSEALGVTPSVVASGLAADNLMCALYFTTLYALASSIPAEEQRQDQKTGAPAADGEGGAGGGIRLLEASVSLAVSASICAAAKLLVKSGTSSLAMVTALVVLLATVFPRRVGALAPSAEGLALVLLQVFFASVGASGSVSAVVSTAPSLFLFSAVQIAVHLALLLSLGRLLRMERRLLLLASNANVGGPTTAGGMATAKSWTSLVVPGILCGIFGIAIATPVSIALGLALLRYL